MSKATNVLLITSDQQHWNTLGLLNSEIRTPNLDRLAASGTLFTRAYCCNPTCTPTRASIITGMYPSQHGAYSLGTKLPESVPTLGDRLHLGGYRTALIGKAHFQQLYDHPLYRSIESNPLQQNLDFWRKFNGPFYGFDHVELARNHVDEYHAGQHYALWMEEKGFTEWRKHFKSFPDASGHDEHLTWTIPEEYHYDAWIAERTEAMLKEYAARGDHFFLWASFPDPHPPYLVPEPWDKMYDPAALTVPGLSPKEDLSTLPSHFALAQHPPEEVDVSPYREAEGNAVHGLHSHLHNREELARQIAVYYGMVSMMDQYIGRILDRLDELGLTENTLVVFTTDHGHFYGQHGLTAKCIHHYEDLLRVPMIVSQPGRIPAGKRSDALQSLVDLAPTFSSCCVQDIPRSMTGVDQSGVWFGEQPFARDHVLVENRHQPTTMNIRTYIDSRYKLTVYFNRNYGEMFDLAEDPGEIVNLWDRPECQALKLSLMQKFISAEMGREPLPMPRVCGA